VTAAKPTGEVPWTTEFCQMKKQSGLTNIYMELGSTFGSSSRPIPPRAPPARQIIGAFGADHVLWGTDSIWYGTPQWQIEAFRRFEMPAALVEKYHYAPVTRGEKEQIFGLNAARVFGVDVTAKRNEIPKDYLTRMKMAYLDEGVAPSHRWYGWVTGCPRAAAFNPRRELMARLPDPLSTLTPDARRVYDKITAKRGQMKGGPSLR